jgi:hypothetical protein
MLVAGADAGEAKILEDHPDLTSEDIKACLTYAAATVDPSIVATLSAPHAFRTTVISLGRYRR